MSLKIVLFLFSTPQNIIMALLLYPSSEKSHFNPRLVFYSPLNQKNRILHPHIDDTACPSSF